MPRKSEDKVSLDEAAGGKKRPAELPREDRDMLYGYKAYKRTATDTAQERDLQYARLHDWHHNKNVQMWWDINPQTISRQLFRLKVGSEEIVLSAVELQKYIRWV